MAPRRVLRHAFRRRRLRPTAPSRSRATPRGRAIRGPSSPTPRGCASPRTGIPRSTTTSPRSPLNPSYGEAYSGSPSATTSSASTTRPSPTSPRRRPFRKGDTGLADLEGFVRIGLGDLAGARKSFASVAAALPNDLDARFGLSLLDLSAGKKTEARARLEESLRISPQNAPRPPFPRPHRLRPGTDDRRSGPRREGAPLPRQRAQDPIRRGEPRGRRPAISTKAAFHARNALDLKPGYSEARLLLGSLMYRSRSYDQAIALMREAVARDRKDGMAWYTLGLAQEGAGKRSDAIYSLKTAASLRPDDEVARIALEFAVSRLHERRGPLARALRRLAHRPRQGVRGPQLLRPGHLRVPARAQDLSLLQAGATSLRRACSRRGASPASTSPSSSSSRTTAPPTSPSSTRSRPTTPSSSTPWAGTGASTRRPCPSAPTRSR